MSSGTYEPKSGAILAVLFLSKSIESDRIRVRGAEKIVSANVKTLPYPGYPTDMQAQIMVLMTLADGMSAISENIFENRFIHVSELHRMAPISKSQATRQR